MQRSVGFQDALETYRHQIIVLESFLFEARVQIGRTARKEEEARIKQWRVEHSLQSVHRSSRPTGRPAWKKSNTGART